MLIKLLSNKLPLVYPCHVSQVFMHYKQLPALLHNKLTLLQVGFFHHFSIFASSSKYFLRHSHQDVTVSKDFKASEISLFLNFDEAMKKELENTPIKVLPTNSDNFADFVTSSKILQALVRLGVNLSEVQEKCPQSLKYLLKLDFNKDIKPKIQYLRTSIGITPQEFGTLLTKNMLILDPEFTLNEIEERYFLKLFYTYFLLFLFTLLGLFVN